MTKLSVQLAHARKRKGVPATQVSRSTGFDVSGIYAIENGRRDARESTIESIAGALGAQVLVVDTDHRGSVADAAEEIRRVLADGRSDAAAQVLVQVVANLVALEPLPALAISYEEPAPVDKHWDAALAGVVELYLAKRGLPAPAWTAGILGDENARWDPWTGGAVAAEAAAIPEPLRRRGVWIEEGELAST
jgi:transcriptional regulator with XRE-family HTH domain